MYNQAITKFGLMLFSIYSISTSAAVVELLPGQNHPVFTSVTGVTLGTNRATYVGKYLDSHKQSNRELVDNENSLTFSHNDVIGQTPYILVTSLGYRDIDYRQYSPNYRESNSGAYDLRMGAGFWPWIDTANKHHLGLAVVSTLPTGSYDNDKIINVGENRYRLSGLINFKYQLLPRWYSESFFLYNWMSDNTHYKASPTYVGTLSQEPSMSWTTYLVYQFPQHWQAYVGLEQVMGTDQTLDGRLYGKGQKDFRGYLGATIPLSANNIVLFRYGQSVAVDTGYKQDHQMILKFSHLW